MELEKILNSYNLTELKKHVRNYNAENSIKGYSKLTKEELIKKMLVHGDKFKGLKMKEVKEPVKKVVKKVSEVPSKESVKKIEKSAKAIEDVFKKKTQSLKEMKKEEPKKEIPKKEMKKEIPKKEMKKEEPKKEMKKEEPKELKDLIEKEKNSKFYNKNEVEKYFEEIKKPRLTDLFKQSYYEPLIKGNLNKIEQDKLILSYEEWKNNQLNDILYRNTFNRKYEGGTAVQYYRYTVYEKMQKLFNKFDEEIKEMPKKEVKKEEPKKDILKDIKDNIIKYDGLIMDVENKINKLRGPNKKDKLDLSIRNKVIELGKPLAEYTNKKDAYKKFQNLISYYGDSESWKKETNKKLVCEDIIKIAKYIGVDKIIKNIPSHLEKYIKNVCKINLSEL